MQAVLVRIPLFFKGRSTFQESQEGGGPLDTDFKRNSAGPTEIIKELDVFKFYKTRDSYLLRIVCGSSQDIFKISAGGGNTKQKSNTFLTLRAETFAGRN